MEWGRACLGVAKLTWIPLNCGSPGAPVGLGKSSPPLGPGPSFIRWKNATSSQAAVGLR